MAPRRPRQLWWWEPRWSYVPALMAELKSLVRLRALLRMAILLACVIAVLVMFAQHQFPGAVFPWGRAVAGSVGAMIAVLVAIALMHVAIPPIVRVSDRGVGVQHGQSHWFYKMEKITSAELELTAPDRMVLTVHHPRGSRRIGASLRVDPAELADIFGEKLVVKV